MITLSIDVTLIDKTKLVPGKKPRKRQDGETTDIVPKYLNLVLIETPGGKYGDFMVKHGQTKEEREARKQTPILGNAKHFGKKAPEPNTAPAAPPDDDPAF